ELLWELLGEAAERTAPPRCIEAPEPTVALVEPDAVEQTFLDYAILGFCLDRHLMELYTRQRQLLRVVPAARLRTLPHGTTARVAGLVVCRQAPPTARGVLFLTLEDETGLVNVIVPPPVREQYRALLRRQPVLVIDGRVECEGSLASLVAEEVRPLGRPALPLTARAGTLSHDFR
ncbi:MAG: OB-fold nucleic acid binding domain-containing protein, partial [Thermomicrobium sp.]